ncbi:lysophospholipase [Patescibacteria group bacterium]|nr:lysophospholipase [Patescibacteria group bacterium]
MKKLFIKNRQGEKLSVIVEIAKNQKGLVFICHGLGGFKEQSHVQIINKAFIENNYTTIIFDAADSIGESEGDFSTATQTSYYQDLEDVVNWTSKQLWYEEPFVLVGHSAGAASVMIYLDNYTKKVKAIAPLAVAYNGQKVLERFLPPDKVAEVEKTGWHIGNYISKDPNQPEVSLKLNWHNFKNDIVLYDILPILPKVTIPILMIVGSEDPLMIPKYQKIIYDKINSDKELHIIQGSSHTFRESKHLEEIYHIFDKWIKNKL